MSLRRSPSPQVAATRSEPTGTPDASAVNRRQLLRGAGAGIAFFVAGPTLLEACGGGASSGSAGKAPVKGGILVVSDLTEPPALDPVKYNSHTIEVVYRQVTEQLYQWTDQKTIVPLLAASMPAISADGLTYTVKLRQGVTFHNGKAFDSSDVKYSYEQMQNPKNGSIWLPGVQFIKSIDTPDPATAVITLSQVFTPLISKLALLPIVPSNVPYNATVYARSLIGTGPYKFVSWQQGTQLVLKKNKAYWDTGVPETDGITFQFTTSEATRVAAVASGSANLVYQLDPHDVSVLKSRGVSVSVLENSSQLNYMYPNLSAGKATADVNLRQAIAWAIDRKAIISQVFAGYAVPDATLPANGAQYYDTAIGQSISLDLAKAQSYLKAAGGPPKSPLSLVVLASPTAPAVTTIVQENLAKIGINTDVTVLQIAPALQKLFTGDYDLFFLDVLYQESTGFAGDIAYLATTPGAFSNFNHANDKQLYKLALHAVSVPDGPEAQAAWRAVQQRWVEYLPQINLVTSRVICATSHLQVTLSSMADLHELKTATLT
ncbi:MAG TPA: ABC transporter substrate-binding protein [Streptosporangiaceae bacterium]|nr:ABC transporter substrate-binding protein [Streptosporangiaceae bacterium]